MQIIYLLPFVLISLVTGLICVVVPRWRRYAAAAVVAPMAFAVCSITGLMMTILLTESLGISGALGFDASWESQGWNGVLVAGAAYLLAGALGGLVATIVATRLQRRKQFLGSGISANGRIKNDTGAQESRLSRGESPAPLPPCEFLVLSF